MTADELRERLAYKQDEHKHDTYLLAVAKEAITEPAARDREIAELRDELAEERRRLDHAGDVLESRVYSLDEAYEREKIAKDVAYRWWKQARENNYHAWAHLRNLERTLQAGEDCEQEVKEYAFLFELADKRTHEAIAAWREATGQHNVSPDLGVLLEWLMSERVDAIKAKDGWVRIAEEYWRDLVEVEKHAEKLAEALDTISEAYAPSNHPEEVARAALAAYREHTQEETE